MTRTARARRTGVRNRPKIQNMVGPETNSRTTPGDQHPDQRDHDHGLRADPVVEPPRRQRPDRGHDVGGHPEDQHVALADPVHGDGQHRAEREHRGQPVAEQGARPEEVDGVRAGPVQVAQVVEQLAVGADDPEPRRVGGRRVAAPAPPAASGCAKTANQAAATSATTRMLSPSAVLTPSAPAVARDEAARSTQQQRTMPAEVAHRPAEGRHPADRRAASTPGPASRCRTPTRARRRSTPGRAAPGRATASGSRPARRTGPAIATTVQRRPDAGDELAAPGRVRALPRSPGRAAR